MPSPDFEEIEAQFYLMPKCLPISFGDTLPPKLRLRYINLISEIGDLPNPIKRFQSLLAGEEYQKPDWFRKAASYPQMPSADFRKLDDAFQAMQNLLPQKYVDELPGEYQIPYYKILQRHAHLRAKSLRLEEELQQKGLL